VNDTLSVIMAAMGIVLASIGVAISSNPETAFIVGGVLFICLAAMIYEHNKTADGEEKAGHES